MNDLQSYIFENSTDFKEIHYIRIMELMLKAHNQIQLAQVRQPFIRQHVPFIRNEVVTFTITPDEWNNNIKQIFCAPSLLEDIFPNTSDPLIEYLSVLVPPVANTNNLFNFPTCLTSNERQKIHIMSKYDGFSSYSISSSEGRVLYLSIIH